MSETVKETAKRSATATTKTTKQDAVSEKKENKKTVMYLGPSIAGVVTYGTIYNNGIPGAAKEKIKAIPVLASMFVEVDKVGDARSDFVNKNSAFSACYEKVVSEIKKEDEKEDK